MQPAWMLRRDPGNAALREGVVLITYCLDRQLLYWDWFRSGRTDFLTNHLVAKCNESVWLVPGTEW